VTRVGCRALIGRGWAALGDGPLPEGVLAIGAVSHPSLFPRCAAVVHHGGTGTTTTAGRASELGARLRAEAAESDPVRGLIG